MATKLRLGVCSALFVIAVGGACGTESVEDERPCNPGLDKQACQCDDGDDGFRFCEEDGQGFGECDCTGTVGSGGSGGDINATGGRSGGGSGGTGGSNTGGSGDTDAGPDAEADDGGSTDASADSSPDDGGDTDGGLDACNACMQAQCNDELLACASPSPCIDPGDGGLGETDCMVVCILLEADADGGALDQTAIDTCAADCGASGAVAAETKDLFECMFDDTGGSDCIDECLLD